MNGTNRCWVGAVVVGLVALGLALPLEAAWKAAAWKYNDGDLHDANCIQTAIDEFDTRLDAAGLTGASGDNDPVFDAVTSVTITNTGKATIGGCLTASKQIVATTAITNAGPLVQQKAATFSKQIYVTTALTNAGTLVQQGVATFSKQVNCGAVTCTAVVVSGDVTANGNVVGDNATIVTNMALVEAGAFAVGSAATLTCSITNIGFGSTNVLVFTSGLLTGKTCNP